MRIKCQLIEVQKIPKNILLHFQLYCLKFQTFSSIWYKIKNKNYSKSNH